RRNPKAGVDEQNENIPQSGERLQRLDFFAAACGESRFVLQKEGDVGAKRRRDSVQLLKSKRVAKQFVQGQQRRRLISAAATETRGKRQFFFEMNADAITDFCRLQK